MKNALSIALRHLFRLGTYGSIGVFLTLLVFGVTYLDKRPDLDAWHLADLDEEFTEDSPVQNFQEYLALENRLFSQLDREVYDRTGPAGQDLTNRYKRGSLADPQRWTPNWNRSFEMSAEAPRASVLLLHGLSDSPYSLRAMAERLNAAGAHALGLRLPGHGTAPSGLVRVRWQDMAAAVRLAVWHLARQGSGQPLYIVGYSNGAALAVEYALATLDNPDLPRVDALVLLSPEIGLTAAAALAVWQSRLGALLGLEKLEWNDILPEYEPFKYGSFAVNAGDLSHRLTVEIQHRITELTKNGRISGMPPVLAFSSVVDATVLAPALVKDLFSRLPAGGHGLVLFDINRRAGIEQLLKWSPAEMVGTLRQASTRSFSLSLVTNERPDSLRVLSRTWPPGSGPFTETPLELQWPADVYSLSHVALPIPPGDPVYGGHPERPSPGVHLGDLAWRGERDVLQISPAAMLRLRWNPFYPFLEARVLEFLDLENLRNEE